MASEDEELLPLKDIPSPDKRQMGVLHRREVAPAFSPIIIPFCCVRSPTHNHRHLTFSIMDSIISIITINTEAPAANTCH